MIGLIVKLICLPLYISVFMMVLILGVAICSLRFFYLGPFAIILGFPYGLAFTLECFTKK